MGLISSTWIYNENGITLCYWPTYIKSTVSREKAVRNHTDLDYNRTWKCSVNILYRFRDYDVANQKIQRLETYGTTSGGSHSESEQPQPQHSSRTRKAKQDENYDFGDYDSSEDFDQRLIDKPPTLKKDITVKKKANSTTLDPNVTNIYSSYCGSQSTENCNLGNNNSYYTDSAFSQGNLVSEKNGQPFTNNNPSNNISSKNEARMESNPASSSQNVKENENVVKNTIGTQNKSKLTTDYDPNEGDIYEYQRSESCNSNSHYMNPFSSQENAISEDNGKTYMSLNSVQQRSYSSSKPEPKKDSDSCGCGEKSYKLLSRLLRDMQEIKKDMKKLILASEVEKNMEFQDIEQDLNIINYEGLGEFNEN